MASPIVLADHTSQFNFLSTNKNTMDQKHNGGRPCFICALTNVPMSHFHGRRHQRSLERQQSATLVCNDCGLGPGSFINRSTYEAHFSSRHHLIRSRLGQGFTLDQLSGYDGVSYYYCADCNYYSEMSEEQHNMGSRHHVCVLFGILIYLSLFPILIVYNFAGYHAARSTGAESSTRHPASSCTGKSFYSSLIISTHCHSFSHRFMFCPGSPPP